jgi:hypothetical protein
MRTKPFCLVGSPPHSGGSVTHSEGTVALAAELHEMWRRGFEAANGVGAVRMKDDGAGGECDINVPYGALPTKWQAENLSAASHAVEVACYLREHLSKTSFCRARLSDEEIVELVAEQAHVAWLERNGAWAPVEQAVPYADLIDVEKDRVIARLALSAVGPVS